MPMLQVLLVDPDPASAAATQQLIQASNSKTTVQVVASPTSAVARLGAAPPVHVVLLDRSRPLAGEGGLWETLRARAELPVVVLSQSGDDEQVLDAQRRGASQYVQKPLDLAAVASIFSANGMYAFSASRRP